MTVCYTFISLHSAGWVKSVPLETRTFHPSPQHCGAQLRRNKALCSFKHPRGVRCANSPFLSPCSNLNNIKKPNWTCKNHLHSLIFFLKGSASAAKHSLSHIPPLLTSALGSGTIFPGKISKESLLLTPALLFSISARGDTS